MGPVFEYWILTSGRLAADSWPLCSLTDSVVPVLDFLRMKTKTESRTSAKNEEVSLVLFNKAEEAVEVQRVMTRV